MWKEQEIQTIHGTRSSTVNDFLICTVEGFTSAGEVSLRNTQRTLTCHRPHPSQSSQSVGGVYVPLWLLLTSGSSGCFHYCGCWQMERMETVSGPPLHCESTLHKTQLNQNHIPHIIFKRLISTCHIYLKSKSVYWPTHCGSGVLQCGCVVLTQVATSWPRTW